MQSLLLLIETIDPTLLVANGLRVIKLQWDAPRAAHLTGRPGHDAVEPEVGDTPEPFLKRDLQLHAGEIGTYAAVDAETECGVPVFLPVDHNLVGIGDEAGITVGGWERKQNHLASAVVAIPKFRVVLDLARHRHWRIGAQQLFDRGRNKGWLGNQTRTIRGDAGEMPQGYANCAPGGVDARNEQEAEGIDDVGRAEPGTVLVTRLE